MSNEEKINELQEILREDSENYRARRELALLLIDNGYAKEAIQHIAYLLTKFPEDEELYYNLGIAYEKEKLFEDAKTAYLKAIDLSENNYDAIYNLGLVYTELKDFEKGIECFSKVISSDIEDSNSYFNLGLCYLKTGNLVKAFENFQNTIDINDNDIYAHFYMGNILFQVEDYEDAKDEFNKVIEISPDYSWAYYNLACIAFEEGDYESVSKNLDKTIELNPKDENAYINYAKLLTKLEMYTEAKTVMDACIQNCQNVGQLNYYAAQIAKIENNSQDYVKYLNEAIINKDTLALDVYKVMAELEKFNDSELT